jgi:osmotically-inducible protein OsmY
LHGHNFVAPRSPIKFSTLNQKLMADNRNQPENRYSNQDWDNDNNRQQRNWENRYNQENQGYNSGYQGSQREGYSSMDRDSGYSSQYGRQSDQGNFGNRWNQSNREGGWGSGSGRNDSDSNYGSYSSGQYGSGSGSFGNQDRNYGYGGREYGSSYGSGMYSGNRSYYDSGSYGSGSGSPSYGSTRNLYDRDYERFDRGFNSGYSGLGGSNYGGYGDRSRRGRDENPYYGSTNYQNYRSGRSDFGRGDFGRGDSNDRSWWDRTKDEVSSWFGDDEAERRRERDQRLQHRGRGPKNYTRSDERIKEDINDRLSDDSWVDASEVEVTVTNGEVTLTGTVNDRNDKRRAEDIAEAVSGVKNVENRIRVTNRFGSGVGTTGSSGSSYATSTEGSQTGTTGMGSTGTTGSMGSTATTGTTGTSGQDKNKNKSSYVTG